MPKLDTALPEYRNPELVRNYEEERFSSRVGRYAWKREQRALGQLVAAVGEAQLVLDCPCGIGRWVPLLARLAPELIVEADVSPAMLEASHSRNGGRWPCCYGSAEELPFPDASFDLVFCHALTKHLPNDDQALVLRELSRVSGKYVICSFSLLQGLPGLLRKFRNVPGGFGVTPSWLKDTATSASLNIQVSLPCTTPVGVEHSVLFSKMS